MNNHQTVTTTLFTDTHKESDLEKWAEDGPLSKRKYDRMINEFEGQTMEYALSFLTCQLTPPSLTVKRDKARSGTDDYIEVTFTAPGFIPGQSILDIQTTTSAHISGHLVGSWDKQQPAKPSFIEPVFAKDETTQIGTKYFYEQTAEDTKWQIRARHINKDQMILPPAETDPPTYHPVKIDPKVKGWVYGEIRIQPPTNWTQPIAA